MRTLIQDWKTPVKYIDRTWLRRSTLGFMAIPSLVYFMLCGAGEWWVLMREIWRSKYDPRRLPK